MAAQRPRLVRDRRDRPGRRRRRRLRERPGFRTASSRPCTCTATALRSPARRPVFGPGPARKLRDAETQEIGEREVTVNAVIPTATDGAGYFTESNADDPLRRLVQNASPLGSRMGTVDDVADAVEFFTGELARWISGQQLLVSGGALS
ncbi:SDR family oxidoreductase [Streptomyces sp. uw30]|uniref:SDR family oxidoreductase n=1 Tax=Streptomyces sp. uw30 TaxID=1828179 RepID=UPI0011CD7371|nr:SDR family oxidoreductase [Streptomyces sp. uw30]TXS50476.1 SDR family oxidoreductase [Streptomyces sp. uw30]